MLLYSNLSIHLDKGYGIHRGNYSSVPLRGLVACVCFCDDLKNEKSAFPWSLVTTDVKRGGGRRSGVFVYLCVFSRAGTMFFCIFPECFVCVCVCVLRSGVMFFFFS